MNYTSKSIKIVTTLAILIASTNLNAFSLFGTQSPKECYIYNKGKLSFLDVLANQSMYVKTGKQIEKLLSTMNMSGNNSQYFIKGRKDIVSDLLDIRYARSTPIPKEMLFSIIGKVKRDQSNCIKQNRSNNNSRGW